MSILYFTYIGKENRSLEENCVFETYIYTLFLDLLDFYTTRIQCSCEVLLLSSEI